MRHLGFPGLVIVLLPLWGNASAVEHRQQGYQYLSPVPGAEYVAPGTEFVLVRFAGISPGDLTNLNSLVRITGQTSGVHGCVTRVSIDDVSLKKSP